MVTGRLMLTGYGGDTEQAVEVVGQTPKRFRIRAITRTKLPGRLLEPGQCVLVPRYAVVCDSCSLSRELANAPDGGPSR